MFQALSAFEGPFLLWVQETLRGPLDGLVSFYTHLGDHGALWIAICLALLLFPKTRKAGLAVALALVCSLLLTNGLIKNIFQRPRPWLVVEGLVPLVVEPDPNSFPSGHTSAAFGAAVAFFLTPPEWFRKGRGTLLALAALMGLSRLYVGVHFPSDVLCGLLVGCLCGYLGAHLAQCVKERMEQK